MQAKSAVLPLPAPRAARERRAALATVVLDLGDLVALAHDDDDDAIEVLDAEWLEPHDDTTIEAEPDATRLWSPPPQGYPPGLDDAALVAAVAELAAELCRGHRRRA